MGQTQGGNAGNLELLKKINDTDERLILTHITLSDFFESTQTVELIEMEVVKTGTTIALYARIKILSELVDNRIGTIKEPYRPNLKETIGSIHSITPPYSGIGSIWVGNIGDVRIYGYEVGKQYYISVSWLYLLA